MVYIFKKFKYKFSLIFAIVFSSSSASGLESFEERELATMIGDKYFIYPSNVIEYSVSGSSLIEFNLNSRGEVENLQIIESLGIPFDKSIIDGLSLYVSNEIVSINDNIKNQYRLEIKFEN
tara:strand:+ start:113 stop:475 length:363 start_codon:yes stop_codon:yes gene_type:complete